MSPRSSVMPIVASGTVNMAKLLIATMAVAGAYVGAQATQSEPGGVPVISSAVPTAPAKSTGSTAAASAASTTGAFADRPTRVMTLTTPADETDAVPRPGTVEVTMTPGGTGCERTYRVRTVIGSAGSDTSYGWQIQRWNSATGEWQPYFASRSGFTGGPRAVEWRPRIGGNPGRYRVRLDVASRSYESATFQITC